MVDCTIPGDDAMYGLGIRLGLYFQWTSTVLSIGFAPPEQAKVMHDVNTYFTVSTLISLFYITAKHQSSASEIITVLSLCSGGAILTVATRPENWFPGIASPEPSSHFGLLLQDALIATVTYYQTWFFFHGMDTLEYASCTQYQFFFAKVSIYGWLRTINKVIVLLWTVVATVSLCRSMYKAGFGAKGGESNPPEKDGAVRYLACAIAATKLPALLVANAELIIRWNNIQGVQHVNNTGQIIPLTIGVLGFIQTVICIFRDFRKKRKLNNVTDRTKTMSSQQEDKPDITAA